MRFTRMATKRARSGSRVSSRVPRRWTRSVCNPRARNMLIVSCSPTSIWVSCNDRSRAAELMIGNYVIDRSTGRKIFESMPVCES